MPAAGPYTDHLDSVFAKIDEQNRQLSRIERMVKALYDLEEFPPIKSDHRTSTGFTKAREDMTADEEVMTYGQRIAYNLLDDPNDVNQFQQFLYECKTKFRHKLHDRELEMVDYADKGFADVRLSDKHLHTLKRIYLKVTGKQWPYHTKSGFMYKLDGPYQPVWTWDDEP